MTDTSSSSLDRRNMLRRIGLVAAAYSIPAVTTLSMAQASSKSSFASGGSNSSASVSGASNSGQAIRAVLRTALELTLENADDGGLTVSLCWDN